MLDPKNEKYTDNQLLAIRNYLIELARLNVQLILSEKEKRGFNKNEGL